ncbi:hypothetical protein IMX26_14705 [Clostridium sp. 'deep sea']|uniref:hypothetical protein n=1 Tax=Clostridium sp. 'deep sea' TaxID=2779445 RepID=UPI0018967630|nr:hypothetical protein [Clostridium sp. 'deep sea']QOR34706.1 hypothetical protein IMX26_14705 [Clostridium sp. 'deep sea']
MSKTIKRILAALLIIIGGIVLVQMFEDKFVKMFITACIVFFATYLNKRTLKRRKLDELRTKLEKEIEEEELAEQQNQTTVIDTEASEVILEEEQKKVEEEQIIDPQ